MWCPRGTPGGIGHHRGVYQRPGEVAEVEITVIGRLTNPVVAACIRNADLAA